MGRAESNLCRVKISLEESVMKYHISLDAFQSICDIFLVGEGSVVFFCIPIILKELFFDQCKDYLYELILMDS